MKLAIPSGGKTVVDIIRTAYRIAYEISPIILRYGIAPAAFNYIIPIVALTEIESAAINLLNGKFSLFSLDDYFSHWEPMSGSQLFSYQIAEYPAANQTVAANAVIKQPLNVSMVMKCPVKGKGGYISRLATMTAMKLMIDQHINLGGYFDVLTPSWLYTGMLLTSVSDITNEQDMQKQIVWRWDFQQPLITNAEVITAFNNSFNKMSKGLPVP